MGDFSIISRFNSEANFKNVRIGADCPLLEVELNEMQEIATYTNSFLARSYFGDGIEAIGTYTYQNSKLIIENENAIINGNPIYISKLELNLNNNETAYIKIWEELVSYDSPIKKYGNVQEKNIENHLLDTRIGKETSKRVQLKYDLVKTKPTTFHLKIGKVFNNTFILEAPLLLGQVNNNSFIDTFTSKTNQATFTLTNNYRMGVNALMVFVNNSIKIPNVDYRELTNNSFSFNTPLKNGDSVVIYYNSAIMGDIKKNHHNKQHEKNGSDPLEITLLADKDSIIPKIVNRLKIKTLDGGNFTDNFNPSNSDIIDGGYF